MDVSDLLPTQLDEFRRAAGYLLRRCGTQEEAKRADEAGLPVAASGFWGGLVDLWFTADGRNQARLAASFPGTAVAIDLFQDGNVDALLGPDI